MAARSGEWSQLKACLHSRHPLAHSKLPSVLPAYAAKGRLMQVLSVWSLAFVVVQAQPSKLDISAMTLQRWLGRARQITYSFSKHHGAPTHHRLVTIFQFPCISISSSRIIRLPCKKTTTSPFRSCIVRGGCFTEIQIFFLTISPSKNKQVPKLALIGHRCCLCSSSISYHWEY